MDLTHLRADTPGCTHRVHLNNASASLMPASVLRAIVEHLELEARVGGYEAAAEAAPGIEAAYRAVADLLATASGNVALTEHATAAFVQALSSVPLQRGDLVLTTRQDYVSNQIQYLSLADRFGIQVLRAPDAPEGGVDLQAMEELIHRRRPRIVAVTHVPTNSGLVQDVEAIGKMCRARDILYLVDACQSVGQMPVHPEALGCDFQPAPDARRFETWEFAWRLILGTGEAARYPMQVGLDEIQQRTRSLAKSLRERLGDVPGVRVLDRGGHERGLPLRP